MEGMILSVFQCDGPRLHGVDAAPSAASGAVAIQPIWLAVSAGRNLTEFT